MAGRGQIVDIDRQRLADMFDLLSIGGRHLAQLGALSAQVLGNGAAARLDACGRLFECLHGVGQLPVGVLHRMLRLAVRRRRRLGDLRRDTPRRFVERVGNGRHLPVGRFDRILHLLRSGDTDIRHLVGQPFDGLLQGLPGPGGLGLDAARELAHPHRRALGNRAANGRPCFRYHLDWRDASCCSAGCPMVQC